MLLYEIWSLGHSPFPHLTPMQVCCVVATKHHSCEHASGSALCDTYLVHVVDAEGCKVSPFHLDWVFM